MSTWFMNDPLKDIHSLGGLNSHLIGICLALDFKKTNGDTYSEKNKVYCHIDSFDVIMGGLN